MKALKLLLSFLFLMGFMSCKKDTSNSQTINIPNGDFEYWDGNGLLVWQTNSCIPCVPQFQTYIVQKTTDAYSGKFAAKFVYNNVYKSWAYNKFPITIHPSMLTGYVKSSIANGDTTMIHIDLFLGTNIVDSGNWYGTSSIVNYKKIEIPISQTSSTVDSASIKIVGGGKQNTELYVDDLVFIKTK
ncbi:MAG TPA: hypothetical protein VMU83_18840 [Hanamia sp.]|nr:hypothetical protein [Hanamia sp.]